MKKTPDAIFIIDTCREEIAVNEARRLNIPIVGTLDTNCDPDDVDYGIPANDDAIRSVRLLCNFIADAVIAGTGADVTAAEMSDAATPAAANAEVQQSDVVSAAAADELAGAIDANIADEEAAVADQA